MDNIKILYMDHKDENSTSDITTLDFNTLESVPFGIEVENIKRFFRCILGHPQTILSLAVISTIETLPTMNSLSVKV